jgi:hypothetical protein
MRITPIEPPDKPRYQRHRAVMSLRNMGSAGVEHAVIDTATGERTVLPPKEAWELHQRLNMEV